MARIGPSPRLSDVRRRWVGRDGMTLVGGRGSAFARLSGRGSTGRKSRPTTRAGCAFRLQGVQSRCRAVSRQTMRAHRCGRWNSADRGQSAVDGWRAVHERSPEELRGIPTRGLADLTECPYLPGREQPDHSLMIRPRPRSRSRPVGTRPLAQRHFPSDETLEWLDRLCRRAVGFGLPFRFRGITASP